MAEINPATQRAKIRSFGQGLVATLLINMGAELEIFEALKENKEGMTVSELAAKLNLQEPTVKIWCQTAYHLEILDADDQGRFKLQPFLDEILGDKTYFRNYLATIALVAKAGESVKSMVESLKTGKSLDGYYNTPEFSKLTYKVTKDIPMIFLFMIFPKFEHLKQNLEQGSRVLDIGCGNGNLIIQLAQAFGNSTFIGVNPDLYGIESAKATISQLGLGDRVAVEHMGGEELSYKNEFDMASMVVTLHEIRPDVREEVVRKAYQALKKDGHLLVLDFPYPSKLEDFRNPAFDFGIGDQFFECFSGFYHLDNEKQNEVITNAGFTNIQRMRIGRGMFDFITAIKS
jgi:SAM-dependent methyltransferase